MIPSVSPSDSLPGTAEGENVLLRRPPANIAAEQALLGAILTNNTARDYVSDFLEPFHFAEPVHGAMYESISNRIEAGKLADVVTMRAEFEHRGILDAVGGPQYLADLLRAMVGTINARDYGKAIHDCWLRRQLIEIGEETVNNAFGAVPELTGTEQISTAEERLFGLATQKGQEGGFITLARAVKEAVETAAHAFQKGGEVVGLTSGLRDFDRKTGGLHPSDLLILAGRPAMGKTSLAMKIAFEAAKSLEAEAKEKNLKEPEGCVAFFSLEMSAEQLALRILSDQAEISGERIRRGDIQQKEFDRFFRAGRTLERVPLHIDPTGLIPLSTLRTRCRRLHRTKGLKLIVVDYLQLIQPSVGARTEKNMVQQIALITQGLKGLAKELSVPVIALSQLSRSVESREDKRPMLSDLRDSGAIEQDADIVMFVYREEYYLQQRQPQEAAFESGEKHQAATEEWQRKMNLVYGRADLILEKNRHGPTGTIPLRFTGEFTRFSDADETQIMR